MKQPAIGTRLWYIGDFGSIYSRKLRDTRYKNGKLQYGFWFILWDMFWLDAELCFETRDQLLQHEANKKIPGFQKHRKAANTSTLEEPTAQKAAMNWKPASAPTPAPTPTPTPVTTPETTEVIEEPLPNTAPAAIETVVTAPTTPPVIETTALPIIEEPVTTDEELQAKEAAEMADEKAANEEIAAAELADNTEETTAS